MLGDLKAQHITIKKYINSDIVSSISDHQAR